MQQKAFTLINKGMNRDLSISKAGESSAFSNHNIRIEAREHGTLLSVTNERGTKDINLGVDIEGTLIGWNVLNEHIILFTTDASLDRIYRIDHTGDDEFVMRYGRKNAYTSNAPIYTGHLGFSAKYPIESVVYMENENIKKIYWVDGKNVLRFMNFMEPASVVAGWAGDNEVFDVNKTAKFGVSAEISKDNSGNTRSNGISQYFLTYYNLHGQETGIAWMSDLVYLSPIGSGGAADGTNNNKITFSLSGMDTSFYGFRLYSTFRSSLDGTLLGYLVYEGKMNPNGAGIAVDDGAHLVDMDASQILFLGSQPLIPGTLAHKDQTLFLGDLSYNGTNYNNQIETIQDHINDTMFEPSGDEDIPDWEASCITFIYSDSASSVISDIPYIVQSGTYSYKNQLDGSSSQITTFKGGEKYRFALVFEFKNGVRTRPMWIGDKVNKLYPIVDVVNNTIKRACVQCDIPVEVITAARAISDLQSVQLQIAEATYADRSVKAQGIINPTVFNVWERFNDRLYAAPSWISRPRGSSFAFKHFEAVHKSTSSTGEIECNYWTSDDPINPYYQLTNLDDSDGNYQYKEKFEGASDYERLMIVYGIQCFGLIDKYKAKVWVVKGHSDGVYDYLETHEFVEDDTKPGKGVGEPFTNYVYDSAHSEVSISVTSFVGWFEGAGTGNTSKRSVYNSLCSVLRAYGIEEKNIINYSSFSNDLCKKAKSKKKTSYYYNAYYGTGDSNAKTNVLDAFNIGSNNVTRWRPVGSSAGTDDAPARFKKHLMFIDENVVTLNSPEVEYGAISLDNVSGYKLRIVGAAKITGNTVDYTVDASHGYLSGQNLVSENFSSNTNVDGLTAWPLWSEFGLSPELDDNGNPTEIDPEHRVDQDYHWDSNIVNYWLHMWKRSGIISGFDKSGAGYSELKNQVFANMRFANTTIYQNAANYDSCKYSVGIRQFDSPSSQYMGITVGDKIWNYDGVVRTALSVPGQLKYPILYTRNSPQVGSSISETNAFLYSDDPVEVTYASNRHLALTLPMEQDNGMYIHTILPYIFNSEKVTLPQYSSQTYTSGPLVPWIDGQMFPILVDGIDTTNEQGKDRGWLFWDGELYEQSGRYSSTEPPKSTDVIDEILAPYVVLPKYGNAATEIISKINTVNSKFGGSEVYVILTVNVLVDVENDRYELYNIVVPLNSFTWESVDEYNVAPKFVNAKILSCAKKTESSSPDNPTRVRVRDFNYASYTPDLSSNDIWDLQVDNNELIEVGNNWQQSISNYSISQDEFVLSTTGETQYNVDKISASDKYLYIGEVYYDYDSPLSDTRYGGIENTDQCRFIPAGPSYALPSSDSALTIYGNQGDTYFQRWDCLKTKPHPEGSVCNTIDITSFMVESHINLDGRTDLQRGTGAVASIRTENFGTLNTVYSQRDNFIVGRTSDDSDATASSYRSSITWTLGKNDAASVDEWTHITLASMLNLDGDKGPCNAIRKIGNSLVSFQDRCISEILFNSRTQISATDGTPIEIANTGRVDGKRIISNKYGCTNKWSIVEGKNALYFVDNINKAFCAFNGESVQNLSERLGFGAWFRKINNIDHWTPEFDNVVSFYDRIHSDVYLVGDSTESDEDCLVFNENLGVFTSFFDYGSVPMMANVNDKFIAFNKTVSSNGLWIMNEGLYSNLFGQDVPFSVQYRVTPDPFGDKVWTNIDFRADVYKILDNSGDVIADETDLAEGSAEYVPGDTFDKISVWNEYQKTVENINSDNLKKKFRIWGYQIPRCDGTSPDNTYGLDRIRNPWVSIKFVKNASSNNRTNMMQIHDAVVKYFE